MITNIMQTSQLVSLLLILSVWTISCFPSKPLNERSTELTWQAWLLIDESQNKQQDSSLRRRITPKSVFIAPTFSPESLPECSEGYQSDSMGRCIKIIMLNKELHLDFLLQQLNQKFGGMDDYEDEDITTSGPVNINIPLIGDVQEETDIAIVVAPTNGMQKNEAQTPINMNLSEEKVNVRDIAGILGLKQPAEVETTTITSTTTENATPEVTTGNFETTTINAGGSTSELNALFFLDPKRQQEIKNEHSSEATTLSPSTLETEYTATDETTTQVKRETVETLNEDKTESPLLQMDQALPFEETLSQFSNIKREAFKPNAGLETTESTWTETYTKISSTKFEVMESSPTTSTSIVLTPIDNSLTNQDVNLATKSSTASIFSPGFQKPSLDMLYNKNNVKFLTRFDGLMDQKLENKVEHSTEFLGTTEESPSTNEDSSTTQISTIQTSSTDTTKVTVEEIKTTTTTENFVFKFPSEQSSFIRFPSQETNNHNIGDAPRPYDAILSQYAHLKASATDNHRNIYPPSDVPSHLEMSQTLYQRYKAHRDNHRNREKHSEWFHLPPKWSDNSQKPVVLRFSRKHGYIDSQQLGSNNFYREINPRLFGFPKKTKVQR